MFYVVTVNSNDCVLFGTHILINDGSSRALKLPLYRSKLIING